jgi:acid phosphatase family membrane protein YuiD
MPSSHASTVSALATSVGLTYGFTSPFFAITFFLAFITMFDAQGVRRQSGHQAEALNQIIEDIYLNKGIKQERLKELLGHTPVQVFIGAAIGIIVALFCYL